MKPRFSILTLLGSTAYIAVAMAAFRDPYSIAYVTNIWAWLAVLVYAVIAASSGGVERTRVFAIAFAACAVLYTLADWHLQSLSDDSVDMPSQFLVDPIAGPPIRSWGEEDCELEKVVVQEEFRKDIRRLVGMNSSLVFGVLGGVLALWRYRVLERREKNKARTLTPVSSTKPRLP